MIGFMFPGQGSQKRGMGAGLFDEVREFASIEREVDAILGYSVRQLCLEDPGNRLKETQFTQPSLYIVNALHYYKARSEQGQAAYLAGHSLGEYNALLAAGVFDFTTGLKLVQKRGELMSRAANGGMAAVIGLSAAKIADVIRNHGLAAIDVANFNSPSQIVISGPVELLERSGRLFEQAGARMFMRLPVSAAFHSRYMQQAAEDFGRFLTQFEFNAPEVPVISNVTARPYERHEASTHARRLLVEQITHSVQWTQTIAHLLSAGVKELKEIGPGNVLTRLAAQIQAEANG